MGTSILDQPETIGYLKSLGLDYGWGPTSLVEWILEHVHVLAGTPWWASITLTALLFRVAFFYPYLSAADNAAKMKTIQPIIKPLMEKQSLASSNGDTATVMELKRELNRIRKRAGVSMIKGFVPMLSVFTGYGSFVLLRAMANLPVPAMETGGLFWFRDLTVADPAFILPLLTSGILHIVLKRGGETGANTMSAPALKLLSIGLPTLSFLVTAWMPAGLQLSFFIGTFFSWGQARLFQNREFRAALGMYPLETAPAAVKAKNTLQDRVIVAKPNTYSTMSPTYSPPRGAPEAADTTQKSSILSRTTDAWSGFKKSGKELVKDAEKLADGWSGGTPSGKRTKAEMKAAAAYEERAAERDRQEREQLTNRERARALRKRNRAVGKKNL